MLNIILASIFVGIGSYLLRRGDLFELLSCFFKVTPPTLNIQLFYTLSGIFLNLVAIYFWQSSAKSEISYPLAYSIYLSVGLVVGIITSSILEKVNLGSNVFFGTFIVTLGIVILTKNN